MRDCKVVLTADSNEKLNIECENASIQEMALLLGVFAAFVATEATMRGMPVDDVKDVMLEVFLASTAKLTNE